MPATDAAIAEADRRLRDSDLFEQVEVRKRFVSLDDPSQVLLVVIVDEGDVRIERTDDPEAPVRVVRGGGWRPMFLPILGIEYSYGFHYGVRVTFPDALGVGSQVSVPASWGGHRQVGMELAKVFEGGPISRVAAGGIIEERTNPYFDRDDLRRRIWARGDRMVASRFVAGAHVSWQEASLGDVDDQLTTVGVDLTYDGRLDPYLARNAVYGRAAWERVFIDGGDTINRVRFEGRGYVGLFGQSTLVMRALKEDADRPLPPYLLSVLGGGDTLRGFPAGSAVGDTLVAGALELRLPLTSPLGFGRLGLSGFFDAGTVYAEGARLSDQSLDYGGGGGLWITLPVVRLTMSVAHGSGGSTTFHIATGMEF
jgi:outer membrane protein assembly factor BamA